MRPAKGKKQWPVSPLAEDRAKGDKKQREEENEPSI